VSPKKRQQTFGKMKREQAVRERRERKQEAKKVARELKAAARAAAAEGDVEAANGEGTVMASLAPRRGVVTEAATEAGYGFIEPDDRGGQLPMRASEIDGERLFVAGESVEYSLAAGSLGVEAVDVKPLEAADR
jgi:cold shock CspA family protein